jgi:hypothetical protein
VYDIDSWKLSYIKTVGCQRQSMVKELITLTMHNTQDRQTKFYFSEVMHWVLAIYSMWDNNTVTFVNMVDTNICIKETINKIRQCITTFHERELTMVYIMCNILKCIWNWYIKNREELTIALLIILQINGDCFQMWKH